MLASALAVASSAFALRRLGHSRDLALALGLIYASLPYAANRGAAPVDLTVPLAPLLVLLALRNCDPRTTEPARVEVWLVRAACLALGATCLDTAFFAAWLLLVGAGLGWLANRNASRLRATALGLVLLLAGAATPLILGVPGGVESGRRGAGSRSAPEAADPDTLGLHLRHLLLPANDHPFPPLRQVAARMGDAFEDHTEAATARLGTLGSFGLLLLVGFACSRVAPRSASSPPSASRFDPLGPAAALTLAALLLAQVGGLGSLLSAVATPDIRAYHRFVVFIGFLSTRAVGCLIEPGLGRVGRPVRLGLLVLLVGLAIADQMPRQQTEGFRSISALGSARGAEDTR